ncbi:MAG: extracellular catalytic domain type 1 short-chain-length polyhydroxyalkanoate depolymerase [Janthinobacterium lividum]
MNPLFQQMMTKASQLTQGGNLQAATEAIQRALNPGRQEDAPATFAPPAVSRFPFARSAARPAVAQRQRDSADIVIDGCVRVLDDATATTSSTATPPPVPSPAETTTAAPERWTDGSFSHQGRTLAYKLYVPPRAAGSTPAPRPLILMLHGCTQDPADFAAGTRMNELARREGFVVLYPAQTAHANSQKCWNWFKTQHQRRGSGEPALLAALTRNVAEAENVDGARIYAAGLSAGGAMADILGQTYPDLFAAVGVHSGLPAGSATDLMTALAAMRSGGSASAVAATDPAVAAVPVIVFHGDADSTVNVANGAAVAKAALARAAGPAGRPAARETTGTSPRGQGYVRTDYPRPDGGTAVELWTLHGAGHAWSGGSASGSYTDARGVDASSEMLRFFLSHPMRP